MDYLAYKLVWWLAVAFVVGVCAGAVARTPPTNAQPRIGRVRVAEGWLYMVEGHEGLVFVPSVVEERK